jgi:hypothetical protein
MIRPQVFTTYKGERLNMSELSTRTKIVRTTLWRWYRAGRLTEARIRYHLKERERVKKEKETAAKHGVPWKLSIRRRGKEWDDERALTVPRRKWERKVAHAAE